MFKRSRMLVSTLLFISLIAIPFVWAKPHASEAQSYTVTVSEYAIDDDSYVAELYLVDFSTKQIDREGMLVLTGETEATIEQGGSDVSWELTVEILNDEKASYSLKVLKNEQVDLTLQGTVPIAHPAVTSLK